MTEGEKLLPCPFCGGKPRMYQSQTAAALWRVCCENCDAGPHSYLGEYTAANHWNTRASPSAAGGGEVDVAWKRFELWFFRDLLDITREKFFSVLGVCPPPVKSLPHAVQQRLLKHALATLTARPATEAQTKTEVFRDALERIALLDEADGHELTVTQAFNAVAIACTALGNKHPSVILAERDARIAMSADRAISPSHRAADGGAT